MTQPYQHQPYQYVVLRCVPRVDREEFVNVGVVVFCQAADFLAASCHLDRDRVRALDPEVDLDTVDRALHTICEVADGEESAGAISGKDLGTRFGFLKAPRSTVIQPGPVHGGTTTDPARELNHLMSRLVR